MIQQMMTNSGYSHPYSIIQIHSLQHLVAKERHRWSVSEGPMLEDLELKDPMLEDSLLEHPALENPALEDPGIPSPNKTTALFVWRGLSSVWWCLVAILAYVIGVRRN